MKNINNIINNKSAKTENFIWLMRQAGRYLPEYQKIRANHNNFVEFCYAVDDVVTVTLQPIERFDFDAAIIFSDILLILDVLGAKVEFIPGFGPKITADFTQFIKHQDTDLEDLISTKLSKVYEAITLTRKELAPEKSLIGFVGAFWTLFAYLIEGGSSKNWHKAKEFYYKEPQKFSAIKNILEKSLIIHLRNQAKAGCDIIKIFDSWAGILTKSQITNLVIEPTKNILDGLADINVTKICFPRGIGSSYQEFCNLNFDIYALDYTEDINIAQDIYHKYRKIPQGNLDPALLLLDDYQFAAQEITKILAVTQDIPAIFNLGHGILPETKITNVEKLVTQIRSI